jgi:hypothetical protein
MSSTGPRSTMPATYLGSEADAHRLMMDADGAGHFGRAAPNPGGSSRRTARARQAGARVYAPEWPARSCAGRCACLALKTVTPGGADGSKGEASPDMLAPSGAVDMLCGPMMSPAEIRAEIGLRGRPYQVNDYRSYLGVQVRETGVRSGGAVLWRPEGITIALPPGGSIEAKRQDCSHELGHVAHGDVGKHQPVLYRRGDRRGAWGIDPEIEERATDWAVDALVPEGPLRLAIHHEEIKAADELAREFVVTPAFLMRAAIRYGLERYVIRDTAAYARYTQSAEWARKCAEILSARPVCERTLCGQPSRFVLHQRYDGLGREDGEVVEALCSGCHSGVRLGVPLVERLPVLFDELEAAS